VNPELSAALKIEGQAKMALMVALGALKRTESRGCHNREDYPARNDRDWLSRTLARWKSDADDLPTLDYEPATPVFHLPPGHRGYGRGEIITANGQAGGQPGGQSGGQGGESGGGPSGTMGD